LANNKRRRDEKKARKSFLRDSAVRFAGRIDANRCILPVLVTNPSQLHAPNPADIQWREVRAIIDTGATESCVSHELARDLGLVSHGKTNVSVVGGTTQLEQAPIVIAFEKKDGSGGIHKIVPVAIGDIAVPMLFGMSGLFPGVLTVDLGAGTWEWRVSNAALQSPMPSAAAKPATSAASSAPGPGGPTGRP
jgi:hypothetical protein